MVSTTSHKGTHNAEVHQVLKLISNRLFVTTKVQRSFKFWTSVNDSLLSAVGIRQFACHRGRAQQIQSKQHQRARHQRSVVQRDATHTVYPPLASAEYVCRSVRPAIDSVALIVSDFLNCGRPEDWEVPRACEKNDFHLLQWVTTREPLSINRHYKACPCHTRSLPRRQAQKHGDDPLTAYVLLNNMRARSDERGCEIGELVCHGMARGQFRGDAVEYQLRRYC
ncbi:hypothetical protein FI667_g12186, partial [Globisporangium splendens]